MAGDVFSCTSKRGFHTVYCFELEKSCMVLFGLFMKFQIKENEELTSICDELIAKVGSWNSIITISWHMLMPLGHFIGERNIPTKFHVNWFRIGESNDDNCKIEIYKYGWRYRKTVVVHERNVWKIIDVHVVINRPWFLLQLFKTHWYLMLT